MAGVARSESSNCHVTLHNTFFRPGQRAFAEAHSHPNSLLFLAIRLFLAILVYNHFVRKMIGQMLRELAENSLNVCLILKFSHVLSPPALNLIKDEFILHPRPEEI